LRHRTITQPNDIWAMDITYIPMPRGFVYLAAVMDWASRRVLSWRLSVMLDGASCLAALEEAIARYGRPTILNADQGAQFTSAAFTGVVLNHGIRISMDGKGCWRDNIFIERLWRTLKYEDVYLHAYDSVSGATTGIGRYLTLYNTRRPHSSLTDRTPDEAYFFPLPLSAAV
jgi:putative transposase